MASAFVASLVSGDRAGFGKLIASLPNSAHAWRLALRQVARLTSIHPDMPDLCMNHWVGCGDDWRDAARDEDLLNALRVMLPRYQGPERLLYRGDSAWNRRRRSYGMSWSASIDTAEGFARGVWRSFEGGSVLLQVDAPAAAIICAVHGTDGDAYGEMEYLVDRRRLGRVQVLRRYSQCSIEAAGGECGEEDGGPACVALGRAT